MDTRTENYTGKKVISGLFESGNVRKFKAIIKFRDSEMSGILILKRLDDSITIGSFINEFGIKGFDFTLAPGGIKFNYLFRKLDKWYIRNTLGSDLQFLFLRPEIKTKCTFDNRPVFVKNINHNVSYVYFLRDENNIEKAAMYKRNSKLATLEQIFSEQNGFSLRMKHMKGTMSYEFVEFKN